MTTTQRPRSTPRQIQPTSESHQSSINVGHYERQISALAGATLLAFGLGRRPLRRIALIAGGAALLYRGLSGHCGLYKKMGINMSHHGDARPEDFFQNGLHVAESFAIDRPAEKLYQYWHNFENLPAFMHHLRQVKVTGEGKSHWVADGPGGASVEWDAQVINDEPGRLIAWKSVAGADVDNAGSVRFLPRSDGRGTQVKITIDYIPPGGPIGAAIAWLFGKSVREQVVDDLNRFRRMVEAGEIS